MTAEMANANQQYLAAQLGRLKARLSSGTTTDEYAAAVAAVEACRSALPAAAPLDRLAVRFGLSAFERDVLLLVAGVEFDGALRTLCAASAGASAAGQPTFALAMAALEGAHWSALTPGAALRYWHLLELSDAQSPTLSPLKIDERVLNHLAGIDQLDDRLAGLLEPLAATAPLAPSQRGLAAQIQAAWSDSGFVPVLLEGPDSAGKRDVAAAGAAAAGLNLFEMPAALLPTVPAEWEVLLRLWERESLLSDCALLIDAESLDASEGGRTQALERWIRAAARPLLVACSAPLSLRRRVTLRLAVDRPPTSEQRAAWKTQLGRRKAPGLAEKLAGQFSLSACQIRQVCQTAAERGGKLAEHLWEACRAQSRPRFDGLAQRIPRLARWADLVLPEPQLQLLREIAVHVRQQLTVYTTWGLESKSARGLGISALFTGDSGTGKTMAAEVLADELQLDLYRIDLSQVVNKYIGETEKNLKRVFDAAEGGGCILLFDEADALFGRRSEVRDSHDRYANVEVSYLLQRMEAFRGLAILTTNRRQALDEAFLRRIRFVVQFAYPDQGQRREIWRRIFPEATPTEELDGERLARLRLAGGNIRNVAVYAAFLAAEAGEPVRMSHIRRALQVEYAKLERPLTEAELRGWT